MRPQRVGGSQSMRTFAAASCAAREEYIYRHNSFYFRSCGGYCSAYQSIYQNNNATCVFVRLWNAKRLGATYH